MSDLDANAVTLLLALMEAPEACISGAALQDFYSHAGRSLITAGALRADGYEAAATCMADHDDAPVALTWRDEVDGYAYFSPLAGWVKVENELLTRYRLEFGWALTTLARQLRVPRMIEPQCLVEDHLWEIGPARIGDRRRMTRILFARRLRQPGVLDSACRVLRERADGRTTLILSSGVAPPPHVQLAGRPIVASLRSCLAAGAGFAIDRSILASRMGGSAPVRGEEPLEVIGDGRTVWFYGERFEFPRGDTQRRVVVHLYERYLQGDYEVPAAEVIADLDFAENTRIDKLFKDSPAWKRLLIQRSGMVSFCWPDGEGGERSEHAIAAE